jgi:EmrB/QacA subfamily drug resistance transporter
MTRRKLQNSTAGAGRVAPGTAAPLGPRRWLAFSSVLASFVMVELDSTVTGTAAPLIRADLGGSYTGLQWMTAAFTMSLAVALLVGGRLGDIFGRRRMLMVGVGGFTMASVSCAAAPTVALLITARAVQGAFAAVMLPQGFGLIGDLFPLGDMKKAWTVFGPVVGFGAALGPLVAGVLIHADLLASGWRMIFLINVPVGAVALGAAARFLPAARGSARRDRLDGPGVLLAAGGAFMLLFPLVEGRALGWPAWSIGLVAASLPTFAMFVRRQVCGPHSGRAPLIEPSVLGRRSFVAGLAFVLAFSSTGGAALWILSVFLQVGLGYTPLRAGLASVPWAMGAMAGSAISGAVMHRLGRRLVHVGLGVMGTGLALLYVVLECAGTSIRSTDLIAPLAAAGIGLGMVFSPMFGLILSGLDDREVGSASSLMQATQQVGISLGVAVVGAAFFAALGLQARHAPAGRQHSVAAAELTVLIILGLTVLVFVLGFLLPDRPLGGSGDGGHDGP